LTQSRKLQIPYSFAPDGKRLAFDEYSGYSGSTGIETVPVESAPADIAAGLRAGKPDVFLQTPFDESHGAFSPDGRWLAYRSNESGVFEVYVRAFPDRGGRWQISNGGGGDLPRWSRDGHELIFRSDQGLMSASYAVQGDTFVPGKARVWFGGTAANIRDYDVTPDGKRVIALQRASAPGDQLPSHLTFLLNFADELRRRSK
jgi:Tol biopolymer transport system component